MDDVTVLRLGAIVPSVNTVIEPLYSRHLPESIALHTARVFLASPLNAEGLIAMRADIQTAARSLASCRIDVVLYLCTASAFAGDPGGEQRAMAQLEQTAGVPVVTVMDSIRDACRILDVAKVALVSPYPSALTGAEINALAQHGITTLRERSFGIDDPFALAAPRPDEILGLARDAWHDDADGFLLTCANFHSQEVIARLEAEFDVPVITSTQAPLWRALRAVGRADSLAGWGRLFDR
jgi:maleate isomerase